MSFPFICLKLLNIYCLLDCTFAKQLSPLVPGIRSRRLPLGLMVVLFFLFFFSVNGILFLFVVSFLLSHWEKVGMGVYESTCLDEQGVVLNGDVNGVFCTVFSVLTEGQLLSFWGRRKRK